MTDRASHQVLLDWEDVLEDTTYYEVLGVLEICDVNALREAYHEFALAFHPDLFRDEPEEVRERAGRVFQRGAEAYRVLSDGELRVKYDMGLIRGQRRLDKALLQRLTESSNAAESAKRPLYELARSMDAKAAALEASRFIERSNLAAARAALLQAIALDGGANRALQDRLEALEVALYAGGG